MKHTALLRPFFLLVFVLCTTIPVLFAQRPDNKKNFDSVYYYTATTLSAQNTAQALKKADSLLNHATDSLQKVKSMMLLATLYNRTGHYADALVYAVNGEKLAGKIKDREWQIRIAGFLSTTFRDLGLIEEGKKYIKLAEALSKEVGTPPLVQMFIHQEKAYYEIDDSSYTKALEEITGATRLLEAIADGKGSSIFKATCYQLAGYCYMKLDSFNQAELSLNKALQVLAGQESELKGFIFQNIGELALKQKQYMRSFQYLDSALRYTTSSDNFNLKAATYESLKDYYIVKGDNKKALEFQSLYTELVEHYTALGKTVSNELTEKLNDKLSQSTSDGYRLYYIAALLILAVISFLVYSLRIGNQQRKKYLAYFNRLQEAGSPTAVTHPSPLGGGQAFSMQIDPADHEDFSLESKNEEDSGEQDGAAAFQETLPGNRNKKVGFGIAKETECRVLNDLNTLEQELFFLQNDITLPFLAATLKINHKYLSSIINRHKGKDFNNYINELRINYIIQKLQDNPSYQDYKIAYLSHESGFSTHSKFTAAFKNITGLSPSTFIKNLKKDTY